MGYQTQSDALGILADSRACFCMQKRLTFNLIGPVVVELTQFQDYGKKLASGMWILYQFANNCKRLGRLVEIIGSTDFSMTFEKSINSPRHAAVVCPAYKAQDPRFQVEFCA